MAERNATAVVREALRGSGIELVASCGIAAYDARVPDSYRSAALLPSAVGIVVAASAGKDLWRRFQARMRDEPRLWDAPHPYDRFVGLSLDRADRALSDAGIAFVRFDAAVESKVRADFLALGQLVGLGKAGPFALLIHREHGPWWALRGAWLVDCDVEAPLVSPSVCPGCDAPCVGGWASVEGTLALATAEVRTRCVVGGASRYDEDQIGYHYDRAATVERLRRSSPAGAPSNRGPASK